MEEEWSLDDEGKFNCPYNEDCHCDLPTCGCCGWNPEVARKRLLEHIKRKGNEAHERKTSV